MLAYLPYKYKKLLVNLFNRFLAKGFIRVEDILEVIFIPKAGTSGVRPISLLSCILKLLEKIVLKTLAESQSLLPHEQMGFRPSWSCNNSLVTFIIFLELLPAGNF